MKKRELIGYCEIIGAVFLWATIEIIMFLMQETTNAILILFFRFSIGGLFLLSLIAIQKRFKSFYFLIKTFPKYYLPAAIIGLTIGMWLFSTGTLLTLPAMAATIISSNPIFISIYMMLFHNEKKTIMKIIGIILGFVGILFIVTEGAFNNFFQNEYLWGNFLVFLGTIFWVLDLIIGKLLLSHIIPEYQKNPIRLPSENVSSLEFNTITFLITNILIFPFIWFNPQKELMLQFSLPTWIGLIFLGLFPTGLAYLLYFQGLQKVPASKGANLFYLKPIFSTLLYFILFTPIISPFFYLGMFLEVIALYLITFEQKKIG